MKREFLKKAGSKAWERLSAAPRRARGEDGTRALDYAPRVNPFRDKRLTDFAACAG